METAMRRGRMLIGKPEINAMVSGTERSLIQRKEAKRSSEADLNMK